MSARTRRWKRLAKAWRRSFVRRRVLRVAKWPFQALALALFWQVCAVVSIERATALGRALLRVLGPWLPWDAALRRNLALACPGADLAEIDRLTREAWGTFGATLAEYPHLKTILGPGIHDHVDVVLRDAFRAHLASGRPAVFVTGHLGNWELSAALGVALDVPLTVVYSRQRNPVCDWMVQRKRQALGCDFVTNEVGARRLVSELKRGHSIGLLVDLRVDNGEPLAFFGHTAHTTVIPARLAMRFACPVVPVRVERLGAGRFRITFETPIWPDRRAPDPHAAARQMMQQVNGILESWIRERPQEWQCLKRRFARKLGDRAIAPLRQVAA